MFLKILFFYNLTFGQVAIIDDFSTSSSHGYKVLQVLQEEYPIETLLLPEQTYITSLKKVLDLKPQVLNLSFGHQEYNGEEFLLLSKISQQGTYIFVASGNSNEKIDRANPIYPCFYNIENLFCVGASENSKKAFWSNYGSKVKIYTSGQFKKENLTSFASPRVSRFFYQAYKCSLNPLEVINFKNILVNQQNQYLIDYSISDFCHLPKSHDPL